MLSSKDVMQRSKVIPVMQVATVAEALHTSEALLKGGIDVFEVTLRTPCAIDAIGELVKEFPGALTGAGTILNVEQLRRVCDKGAHFGISPGLIQCLAVTKRNIPLIPGVATASEIMQGIEYGYDAFKLFPASVVGGVDALKAFSKPFEGVVFCPTGGVNEKNVHEYLALENVLCVGGSWMIPSDVIQKKDFHKITKLTQKLVASL